MPDARRLNLTTATHAELFLELQQLEDAGLKATEYAAEVADALEARNRTKNAIAEVVDGLKFSPENVQALISVECQAIKELLISKNRSYGNSFAEPVRVFARGLTPTDMINVRIDDKLARLAKGSDEMNEDTELDLVGYLILKRVLRRLGGV